MSRPKTSWADLYKYPTLHEAAAALTHSLVHNHPFVDGNKRTAVVSLLAFLNNNKKMLFVTDNDELFDKITALASHSISPKVSGDATSNDPDVEVEMMAKWIKSAIDARYRPMKARKLFSILKREGCVIMGDRQGNQTGIKRGPYRTYISVRSEGQELPKKTVKKVCKDLKLDKGDGFDIYTEQQAADFIEDWRDILDRLAELDRG